MGFCLYLWGGFFVCVSVILQTASLLHVSYLPFKEEINCSLEISVIVFLNHLRSVETVGMFRQADCRPKKKTLKCFQHRYEDLRNISLNKKIVRSQFSFDSAVLVCLNPGCQKIFPF